MLDDSLYIPDTFDKNTSRVTIKYDEGHQGPYEIVCHNQGNEANILKFKVARGESGEGKDPINKGWLFYSQSEITGINRPQVSIAVRHAIPDMVDKLDVLEEMLK